MAKSTARSKSFNDLSRPSYSCICRVTAGKVRDQKTFSEFEGGMPRAEALRWDRYVAWSLPMNPPRRDDRLGYLDDGRPLLPGWQQDTWTRLDGLAVLEVFLNSVWGKLTV